MADEINRYFMTNGFQSQILQQNAAWMVQGRKTGGWLKYVGMNAAGTVIIELASDNTKVSIGGAKWFETGACCFHLLKALQDVLVVHPLE